MSAEDRIIGRIDATRRRGQSKAEHQAEAAARRDRAQALVQGAIAGMPEARAALMLTEIGNAAFADYARLSGVTGARRSARDAAESIFTRAGEAD